MKDFDETRDRFLAEVAGKVPAEKVVEVHLFHPMKQGGVQSGVAVVAVREDPLPTGGEAAAETGTGASAPQHSGAQLNDPDARSASAENRMAVYTARYRLTQKGPDRGKWDFAIHADADAPLVTVDQVVRGVQRRSGDAEDPERLTGEEFRSLLPPPPG